MGDDGEPDTLTVEFAALDAQTAETLALHHMGEMRRRGGVRDGPERVVWVMRLAEEPSSSLRFLDYAKEAIDSEQYEIAVATIQIHLEVQVRVLIEMVVESNPSPLLLATTSGQQRWSPHERWLQPVLEAILGVRLADCPVWADFKGRHIPLRNTVVHGGQEVDSDGARQSIETVLNLWLWLNNAATAAVAASRGRGLAAASDLD